MYTKRILLSIFLLANTSYAQQDCQDYIPNHWQDSRYTDNSDGTVLDKTTNLIWKKCAEGLSGNDCATGSATPFYTWQQALQFANSHTFAAKSDWRLPNIKELESLAALNCHNPSINTTLFPNTPASSFWSSSLVPGYSRNAWLLLFIRGDDYDGDRRVGGTVRLVRPRE